MAAAAVLVHCAGCHADMPDDSQFENASDFLDAHPRFKVSLLQPSRLEDGETEWNLQHMILSESMLSDRSNLKFDHAVHLDTEGIVTPDGRRVIECTECHIPEPPPVMRLVRVDMMPPRAVSTAAPWIAAPLRPSITMPVMTPIADLVGLSRQIGAWRRLSRARDLNRRRWQADS